MSNLKYSRQRESIKNQLMQRNDHPTADMIYTDIRKEYPNISLGTVYRNLALLSDLGRSNVWRQAMVRTALMRIRLRIIILYAGNVTRCSTWIWMTSVRLRNRQREVSRGLLRAIR